MLGIYTASQPPAVRHVEIPIKDLPTNLDGLSLVQISDIHLGPTVGFTKLNMIVDIVNRQNPGNHEYYTGDVDNWFSYLRSLGFTVLHNSNVKIPVKVKNGEGQLCLAGTDDIQADKIGYIGHGFNLATALDGCAKELPVVLMAHQPRAAKQALDSGQRIDLVLSGHTHGGQLFPLMLGAYLLNPFYQGLYQYGPQGSYVYVCEGTQFWGIPMRIGTSTEITHITLIKASL
ncbi:transmembrane protein with metallophosphoesterase domain [Elysia marginata]|uniref:Transmembrane protein with metallophosphoesterase domain n=1 Tax=Elysia marginata TaxID=1093978 RepID=A0AAV4ESL0_9GAST|nr:transmembrane protein with metallophosphoesterase domain [Elysia marginata]